MDFKKGDHLLLSSITSTLHLGAHADSVSHYHESGHGVEERPLASYFGLCQVIAVSLKKGERIKPADIHIDIQAPRILFKTNSFPDPNSWNNDFNSLSPELISMLAEKKVKLVGLDTPSVDPADSKALESHQALFRTQMCVLEGLVLDQIPEGLYILSALPLPIKDADASPVRAVLIDDANLLKVFSDYERL